MEEIAITDVLDLHTFGPRDVKMVVEEYLYQCSARQFRHVRIIHGKGIGVQREMVRSILAKSEFVESFEDGPDWGSTAVTLKK
jgi:DNA-nicking Smr family endonuclease